MPSFLMDIDSYKTRFDGGLRQYLFFALLSFPSLGASQSGLSPLQSLVASALSTFGFGAQKDFIPYLVTSTSLPESIIDEKVIQLQHHTVKIPGDRIYNDWTVTFNIDSKATILKLFHEWQDAIHGRKGSDWTYSKPTSLKADQQLFLVDYRGNAVSSYKLYNAWPKQLGSTQLDYSSNEIATVSVTFSYDYFEYKTEESNDLIDLIKKGVNTIAGKFS